MHELLAFTVVGIVTGAAYAVAASGLVVTYSTSGIFNIAHGAIGMFMAFVFWQFEVAWHWPAPAALAITVLVIAPLFGAVVERVLIRRVSDGSVATTLVVTIGLMVGLIGLVDTIWPPEGRVLLPFFGHNGFEVAGVFVTWEEVVTVGAAVAIAIGLRLLLYRTRVGISMRAVVDNRGLVGLNGGRPARTSTLSWALGAMLASIAGILIAPELQLSVLPLTLLVLDAYAAAMIGRLRNLPLTFAGALLIGLLQSYAVGYMPSGGVWGSVPMQGLRLAIPSILLFITLLALPQDKIRGAVAQVRRAVRPTASFVRSLQGAAFLVVAVVVATMFMGAGDTVDLGTGLALGLIMLSLVPLVGWGGQVSLCQMTFAGLGAFAMARVGTGGSVWGLVAAAGLAGAVGALVALPALRLRGLYLALATMAFAVAMDDMFFPTSTAFSFNGSIAIPRPSLFGLHFHGQRSYVIFLAVVFAVLSVALLALRRGPFGRVLAAMKDSEAACATLGLNLTLTKLVVFALSAAIAGFAGALYGGMESVAGATQFTMLQSLPILLLVVVGGVATCSGALFGGIVLGLGPVLQSAVPEVGSLTLLGTGVAGVTLGANPDGVMPAFYAWAAVWWDLFGDRARQVLRAPGRRVSGGGPVATRTGA
ncbi:MAG TPA: ABC transporter permease [Acidimicrobiales bacterium]|nr:ABC transporter permease [Acidimicrobiales bacterium]